MALWLSPEANSWHTVAVFRRLGSVAARHPITIIIAWITLAASWFALAVVGITGEGLFDRLYSGEPRVPGSESQQARQILTEEGSGEVISLAISGIDMTDPEQLTNTQRALNAFRPNAAAIDGVASILDPFSIPDGIASPAAAPLLSADGDGFMVMISLAADLSEEAQAEAQEEAISLLNGLSESIDASGVVSSSDLIVDSIEHQLEQDLQRGELVALPISLLVMVVVFGGFLAAGIPIIGAIASIAGGLGALYGFSYLLELDSAVVNVVTVLALGLSIDYGLLIVSRYREELRRELDACELHATRRGRTRPRLGHDRVVQAALEATMTSAGRTVTFSGLTVAICVAGLMVMRADILRAVGAAGVSVVVIAVATAVSLVPGLLGLLGRRLARPSLLSKVPGIRALLAKLGDVPPRHGFFSRLATLTQRRPWLVALLAAALLVVMAAPLLGLQLRNSTFELVPRESDQRSFLDTVNDDYPILVEPPVTVVATPDNAEVLAETIAMLDNVTMVEPPQDLGEDYRVLGVRLDTDDGGGPVATAAVEDIRELRVQDPTLGEFWVAGAAAAQVDFVDSMIEGAPLAGGLVVGAIFVLLFLMTGSLLVPFKALIINSLSLAAGLGLATWVFQDGHLEGLLNFTSVGGLESYVVAMATAFGFGLAMDYEVFLLARIKERYDAGEDNDASVRNGLQRTGRVITSAALVMIVVFSGFIAGEMLIIKQVGFTLAVTVLIDATIVRILLVPATMTMLGDVNWWAPKPLRRLYQRFAIDH
ncbi:MAG: MMPL family transporter [Beutenbergiaceae bacterium]